MKSEVFLKLTSHLLHYMKHSVVSLGRKVQNSNANGIVYLYENNSSVERCGFLVMSKVEFERSSCDLLSLGHVIT